MRTAYNGDNHDKIYMKVCSEVLFVNHFQNDYLSLENGVNCVILFGLERLPCALGSKATQYPQTARPSHRYAYHPLRP